MRRRRSAADLLGVAAIADEGLLVRSDGVFVRYLEVAPVNPLVVDQAEGERMSAAFAQVAARLPDRQSLQLYVQGTPLALEEVLAEETHRCEQAAGAAEDAGEQERALAIRRLGIAEEQSIRTNAARVAPVRLRYLVVCPWQPARRPFVPGAIRRSPRMHAAAYERALRESLRHVEGVRSDLEAMGLATRLARRRRGARRAALALRSGRAAGGRAAGELHVPGGDRRAGAGRAPRGREAARGRAGTGDLHRRDLARRAQPPADRRAALRRSSTSRSRPSRRGSAGCFT